MDTAKMMWNSSAGLPESVRLVATDLFRDFGVLRVPGVTENETGSQVREEL